MKIDESTLVQMGREYPTVGAGYIAETMHTLGKLASRHQTLCERYCNEADFDTKKIDRLEVRIQALLAELGKVAGSSASAIFQHDPRGATVKLGVPSKATNDWGQEGLCVLA